MSHFISKLQYKAYEKGEFSDERPRSLEYTLKLINDFPWDEQRPKTDIQLTGPSVTVTNDNGAYLKVALYFNNKFAVYYLDEEAHLFEKYFMNLDDVKQQVALFFNDALSVSGYDKHLFNIGNTPHFRTDPFEYRVKNWKLFLAYLPLLVMSIILFPITSIVSSSGASSLFWLFIFVMLLFSLYAMGKISLYFLKNKDVYLQLSRGSETFYFGLTEKQIKKYLKADIDRVSIYDSPRGSSYGFYQIVFKDGSSIEFSTILIDSLDFRDKFPKNKVAYHKKNLLLHW